MTAVYIGPFRVVKQLGDGGMGHIFLAVSRSGRPVAIKVMRQELADEPELRRRFRDEIAAARAVSGAFTAPVVDADPEATPPWLAVAYIPGPSLQDAVLTHGPMPEPDLWLLGVGLAEALTAVHRAGLVHHDLTPANVLLAADGPRIIDFGVSTKGDYFGGPLGVPGYLPPERIRGQACTSAGDVFSLGAVLIYGALGSSPFGAAPSHVLEWRTLHHEPLLTGVPAGLREVIGGCLHPDPRQRPTAAQVLAMLRTHPVVGAWSDSLQAQVLARQQAFVDAGGASGVARRAVFAGGGVLAVNAALAGAARWRTPISTPVVTPQPRWAISLPHPELQLNVVNAATVVCFRRAGAATFDRADGSSLWSETVAEGFTASSDGTRIYSLRSDGRLHATDARTGVAAWVSSAGSYSAVQQITPSMIVVSSHGGKLYGIAPDTGSVQWSHQAVDNFFGTIAGPATGHLVVHSIAAQVAPQTTSFTFAVLNIESGKIQWTRSLAELHVPGSGDTFYGVGEKQTLLALRAGSGEELWSRPSALSPGAAAPLRLEHGVLFCHQGGTGAVGGGEFTAFDPTDGHTMWKKPITSGRHGPYVVSGSNVCLVDGVLRTFDVRTGVPRWNAGDGLGDLQFLGNVGDLFVAVATGAGQQNGLHGWESATGRHVWHVPAGEAAGDWSVRYAAGEVLASHAGRLSSFIMSG